MPTVIHVSPHPDDESIAVPCTLLSLQNAGWQLINLAVSMGRHEPERRRAELAAALEIGGFVSHEFGAPIEGCPLGRALSDPAVAHISRGDDLGRARRDLAGELVRLIDLTDAALIIGPHPRDGHHGHQTVARAVREVVWRSRRPLVWWMWPVWSELPRPTLVVDCTPDRLAVSRKMLECHRGELGRTDYARMHEAIRVVNAVKGIEKAWGYGSGATPDLKGIEHAELLTEVTVANRGRWNRRWRIGQPRLLDPGHPLAFDDAGWTDLDDMSLLSATRLRGLYRPWVMSLAARLGWPGRYDAFSRPPRTLVQLVRFAAISVRSTIQQLSTWKPRLR